VCALLEAAVQTLHFEASDLPFTIDEVVFVFLNREHAAQQFVCVRMLRRWIEAIHVLGVGVFETMLIVDVEEAAREQCTPRRIVSVL
jgi:hypothetical protein